MHEEEFHKMFYICFIEFLSHFATSFIRCVRVTLRVICTRATSRMRDKKNKAQPHRVNYKTLEKWKPLYHANTQKKSSKQKKSMQIFAAFCTRQCENLTAKHCCSITSISSSAQTIHNTFCVHHLLLSLSSTLFSFSSIVFCFSSTRKRKRDNLDAYRSKNATIRDQ